MNTKTDARSGAVAGPAEQPVRPCAWAHRYSPRGLPHTLRDNRQDAEDDAAIVGGSAHVVALYDELALAAAVAAKFERYAALIAELRCIATRCELPDGDYVSVSLQMWAEDWMRRIEGSNAKLTGRQRARLESQEDADR